MLVIDSITAQTTKDYEAYNFLAEQTFEFPSTAGDFISTGVTANDEFASEVDGDPVVRTYNNFTINEGHLVRPTNRCKGLYLRILGDLIVHGELSMTARGANAPGKYVGIDCGSVPKIHFNETNIFPETMQVISKVGGAGGSGIHKSSSAESYSHGNVGSAGINGACGGGGGGGLYIYSGAVYSGHGREGTSFSGGSGGGGTSSMQANVGVIDANSGTVNGGPGGSGLVGRNSNLSQGGGGGAGNPGGTSVLTGSYCHTKYSGQSGTGGLMILFVGGRIIFGESGLITSNGSDGGYTGCMLGHNANGGGSGGGAIHIFHRHEFDHLNHIFASGGKNRDIGAPSARGGDGGNGSIHLIKTNSI